MSEYIEERFLLGDCFIIVELLGADPVSETGSKSESSNVEVASLWVPRQELTNPDIYKPSRQRHLVEALVTLCHRSSPISEMTLTQKETSIDTLVTMQDLG